MDDLDNDLDRDIDDHMDDSELLPFRYQNLIDLSANNALIVFVRGLARGLVATYC
jgi:hypothetical protein